MPELQNHVWEKLSRVFTRTLDWHETLRQCGLLPVPEDNANEDDFAAIDLAIKRRISYYSRKPEIVNRILELQEQQQDIGITRQQLVAARLAVAQAAMAGNDRYGYNAKEGRFERTGEKIIDYKAADGALAGVAKMLGMDGNADESKNLVVVLPNALLEGADDTPPLGEAELPFLPSKEEMDAAD